MALDNPALRDLLSASCRTSKIPLGEDCLGLRYWMEKRHACKLQGFAGSDHLYRAEGRERGVSNTTKTSLLRASLDAAKVHHSVER